jgi:hypothetical protein
LSSYLCISPLGAAIKGATSFSFQENGLSVGTFLFPTFSGHVKVDMAVKYIPLIKNGHFIAVLELAWRVQEFWCANHTKIPNIDREIKYLDIVSGHLYLAQKHSDQKKVRQPN